MKIAIIKGAIRNWHTAIDKSHIIGYNNDINRAGSMTLGPPRRGHSPPYFNNMHKISVFVDESGDFGKFSAECPFYLITMVFHDQNDKIISEIDKLNETLSYMNLAEHVLHTGPLIRREAVYSDMTINERKKIVDVFLSFFRKLDIEYHTFIVTKKQKWDQDCLSKELSRQINDFILLHKELTEANLVIYYDNGQVQVTNVLATAFKSCNCEFRKITPNDYRLFQIADLITTIELIEKKRKEKRNSLSEKMFFDPMENFKKTYLKTIRKKRIE